MPSGNLSDGQTPPATAVLAIAMPSAARLEAIFGVQAAQLALRELGEAADALMRRLLAQHEIVAQHRQDAAGRWSMLFRLRRSTLVRDLQETCGAIEAAGRPTRSEKVANSTQPANIRPSARIRVHRAGRSPHSGCRRGNALCQSAAVAHSGQGIGPYYGFKLCMRPNVLCITLVAMDFVG